MLRFLLHLICDASEEDKHPQCRKYICIEGMSLVNSLGELRHTLKGWTQDSRNTNLHYCPACSEKRPAAERLRSQVAIENL